MKPERWVIKLGTGVLSTREGSLDLPQMENLTQQLIEIKKKNIDVIIVSSGAISCGMDILGYSKRPESIEELQTCSTLGQPYLMHYYKQLFSAHGFHVAQLLVTYFDLDSLSLRKNIQKLLENLLLKKTIIPIINENDCVSYEEIRFGDNDRLSSHIAVLAEAQRLIILSNVAGLMDCRNGKNKMISYVEEIDSTIEKLAEGTRSERSVGGMITKIEAAKIAQASGILTQIADGREKNVLVRIYNGEPLGTIFETKKNERTLRTNSRSLP
ncbi:glutamate 5-kinase [Methylacidiphilum sp. Yel]|jgi:glutamate 5-kinase|uniref:glutamate 5-kinase n=1 Tax=Methylacidiphilum sp. Yel TaxID=1847730 RepID=UPI00106B13A4|nr:glutamate 5-kinase [Methylacidiphilum sp. Yel]TFE67728.1 glutamate 5-kinase [Methylacidiphilum sp. Yel]